MEYDFMDVHQLLAEPVVGTIEIATSKAQCALYPLWVDGTRGRGITVPVSDGKARVELKAEYATLFYELE